MLEQIYRFSRGNERAIEKVILDENLHYLHMVLNQGERLPEHFTNSNVYMTIVRGLLSIRLSFAAFMRNLRLKPDGSPVLLYNGEEKYNQSAHIAVFDFEIGDQDLQQCADSIIRLYAEYYWSVGDYDKIAFHLTNGFLMEYEKWRDGYRLAVRGNSTSWIKSAGYDDTYDNFVTYLKTVYMYAGTLSLDSECKEINLAEIEPGDLFIEGGSPGHCVLVIDIAENSSGEKAFLLAQGYMPAQNIHVLKNPLHEKDPWYYASEITFPLKTPQWTFAEGSLQRWFIW
jgi:hypothetical protein